MKLENEVKKMDEKLNEFYGCPFCGNGTICYDYIRHFVYCMRCGASVTYPFRQLTTHTDHKIAALAAWNQRDNGSIHAMMVKEWKEKYAAKLNECEDAAEASRLLKGRCEELIEENRRLKMHSGELFEVNHGLLSLINELKVEKQQLNSELINLTVTKEELEEQRTELLTKIASLQDKVDMWRSHDELKSELAATQDEEAKHLAEVDDLKEKNSCLKQRLNVLEKENTEVRLKWTDQWIRISQLEKDLEECKKALITANQRYEEQNAEAKRLNALISTWESRAQYLQAEETYQREVSITNARLSQAVDELNNEVKILQQDLRIEKALREQANDNKRSNGTAGRRNSGNKKTV